VTESFVEEGIPVLLELLERWEEECRDDECLDEVVREEDGVTGTVVGGATDKG